MTQKTPTVYPDSFGLGTTLKVSRTFTDYPASDGWALTLALNGPTVKSFTAQSDGDSFLITISATDSTTYLQAGKYTWKEYASKGAERYLIGGDIFDITPDFSTLAADGAKTDNQKILDAINAKLTGRITSDAESYSIAGRSISKIPFADLMKYKAIFEMRVARERGNYTLPRIEFKFGARS